MKTGRKIANTLTCAQVLTLAHGVFVTTQPGIMIAMGKIAGFCLHLCSRDIEFLKGQLIAGKITRPRTSLTVFHLRAYRSLLMTICCGQYERVRPVIRGVAKSSAQVTVEQNGYTIYKTNVPAGPFAINDLYPTGGSGDLYVTIKESDGSEQHFIVPTPAFRYYSVKAT
ncbi:outer membrane usher protein [Salmonella enterica subsp. enterica]|uniref:Outer membrane usher protein n=1 Tax=Salmonella enterica I TaxID=59201 RepID=A0A3S4GP87_SALET|nr:outer membrane usher protein [Salmonella enterica subsp. enterica]